MKTNTSILHTPTTTSLFSIGLGVITVGSTTYTSRRVGDATVTTVVNGGLLVETRVEFADLAGIVSPAGVWGELHNARRNAVKATAPRCARLAAALG